MEYSFVFVRPQALDRFPSSYWKYIQSNLTAKSYGKLIKTCKLFFTLHRTIIVPDLDVVKIENQKHQFAEQFAQKILVLNNKITINLNEVKIWLTGSFWIKHVPENFCSTLLKFMAGNDIEDIELREQSLTLGECQQLIKKVKRLRIINSKIWASENHLASIADILNCTSRLVKFVYDTKDASQAYELENSIHLPTLREFNIIYSPGLKPTEFCQFVKNHTFGKFSISFYDDYEEVESFKDEAREMFPEARFSENTDFPFHYSTYRFANGKYIYFQIYI